MHLLVLRGNGKLPRSQEKALSAQIRIFTMEKKERKKGEIGQPNVSFLT